MQAPHSPAGFPRRFPPRLSITLSIAVKARSSLCCIVLFALLGSLADAQVTRKQAGSGPKAQQRAIKSLIGPGAPDVSASVASLSLGAVSVGESGQAILTLHNTGTTQGRISKVELRLGGAGTGEAWTVSINESQYVGQAYSLTYAASHVLPTNSPLAVQVDFAPTLEQYDSLELVLSGHFDADPQGDQISIDLSGLGGHEGDPYLHVVIGAPAYVIDYDGSGDELVVLDGSTSHTHEPGQSIIAFDWTTGGGSVSTDPVAMPTLTVGTHSVALEIFDDAMPQRSLLDAVDVDVIPNTDVPGVLARYYLPEAEASSTTLLDAVPSNADFGEEIANFLLPDETGYIGASEFESAMVSLSGKIALGADGNYDFVAIGGLDSRVELGGAPFVGPMFLTAGSYDLEARFAVDDVALHMPVSLEVSLDAGPSQLPDAEDVDHDVSALVPIVNTMPLLGSDLGGNLIRIDGLGFFPSAGVTVHWGATDLTAVDFSLLTPTAIEFLAPAGTGAIAVTVETPQGTSNSNTYQYSVSGPVPINFDLALTIPVNAATSGTVGPDGRLYVARNDGKITALEFDDAYTMVVNETTYDGVSSLSNENILGITTNPYDPATPVRIYVGHGEHYLNGGGPFAGPSPYTGQVSILEGPDFDTPIPLVTGLPTSNHDHAINGIAFDNNGDLYIAVGSNTNAGVKHPLSGNLDESPLSAAIVKALTSKGVSFNGAITYVNTAGGAPNDDQVFGESVDVAPGVDVVVHAPGLRNPFGLVYTTKKRLYVTDNGPNNAFGAASTGPASESAGPTDADELNLAEWGNYYGSPNRNRGRYDPRQNVYRGGAAGPPSIPGVFRQQIVTLTSSTDGIDEYRANTFQGQIRGWLFVQQFQGDLSRVLLRVDGRSFLTRIAVPPFTGALDVVTLPDGAFASIDYVMNRVVVSKPNDLAAVGLVVHDIFPWRAPATGGAPFVLSGVGFGDLGDTSVTIGGLPATLTAVRPNRIEGIVPAQPTPTQALEDVQVTVGGNSADLTGAFRYLIGEGLERGDWEGQNLLTEAFGEVAGGIIGDTLYLVGEPTTSTLAYQIYRKKYVAGKAVRPFPGSHHGAEVIGGKLVLIGGLGGGSEGKVQIYDAATDSWSLGTDMPWAGGSVSTCFLNGKIYVAGGIVGAVTVNNCAAYDPWLDTWTPLANMPAGRNHAASATDGSKFWIFGGRDLGNWVTNGFDTVFAYDPLTDTWESSDDMGSSLVPLPQARGGMGKAIWDRGEFYMFGGETATGAGAGPDDTYDRVDVYDPATNTWRLETPMPTARHGVFPMLFEGRIFLPGGGTVAAFSQSNKFEVFNRQ